MAILAGAFCIQFSLREARALAGLVRTAAACAAAQGDVNILTSINEEVWRVTLSESNNVLLVRKNVMLRFTPEECEVLAELLQASACTETAHV